MSQSFAAAGESRLIEHAVGILREAPGVTSVSWFSDGASIASARVFGEWVTTEAPTPLEALVQLMREVEELPAG